MDFVQGEANPLGAQDKAHVLHIRLRIQPISRLATQTRRQ